MSLQHSYNTDGGFRNICVDEIKVDEKILISTWGIRR